MSGNEIRVASIDKSCIGIAEIKETIDHEFAIYDMSQFLPILGMFDDHNLKLNEDHLVISSDNQSVTYRYTNVENIIAPPYELEMIPETSIITLLSSELNRLIRASSILKLDLLWIRKERDGFIDLSVIHSDYNDTNQFNIELECDESFSNFEFKMKMSALNLLKFDYEIGFCNDYQFIILENIEQNVKYYIAGEV